MTFGVECPHCYMSVQLYLVLIVWHAFSSALGMEDYNLQDLVLTFKNVMQLAKKQSRDSSKLYGNNMVWLILNLGRDVSGCQKRVSGAAGFSRGTQKKSRPF